MTRKLPQITKLIYGSADLGFSLTSTIIGAYFLYFLMNVVGLSGTTRLSPFWQAAVGLHQRSTHRASF